LVALGVVGLGVGVWAWREHATGATAMSARILFCIGDLLVWLDRGSVEEVALY
jgi:hypothetical protein